MNTQDQLFTQEENLRFQFQLRRQLMSTARLPLLITFTALCAVTLGFVAFVEWELIYQVFSYLIGDLEDSWSPALMACTGIIMVIGFHLLAKERPRNPASRFVGFAVAILIPVYLLGTGLLAAGVIYGDGLASMVKPEAQIVIGQISEAVDNGVIDSFFAHVTNPLAVITFSLGIGSLAIINIFVAHKLLGLVISNVSDIFEKAARAKGALSDYRIIQRTQKEYMDAVLEENELLMRDDNYICLSIAGVVLSEISNALLPHRKWLKEHEYGRPSSRFEAGESVDPKQVAKDVAKIAAISQKDILNALKPYLLEVKS